VVLLCDSSKFGVRAIAKLCELSDVDVLVTDAPPPPVLADALAAADIRVVLPATGIPNGIPK
jgi:DeoR family glycerol-3-phosphate regulon repressor